MSVKAGLIGMGVGMTFVAGGVVAGLEGFHEQHIGDQEQACTLSQYSGKTACQNMIVTPASIHTTRTEAKTLWWVGGIAIVVGAIGTVASHEMIDAVPGREEEDGDEN